MKHCLSLLATSLLFTTLCASEQPAPATSTHSAHAAPEQPMLSADQAWASLVAGNKRFVAGKHQSQELVPLRKKLAAGQHPNVIVLSCSDSRVAPELVFDQTLGDLFVVRTAGNVADPVGL